MSLALDDRVRLMVEMVLGIERLMKISHCKVKYLYIGEVNNVFAEEHKGWISQSASDRTDSLLNGRVLCSPVKNSGLIHFVSSDEMQV